MPEAQSASEPVSAFCFCGHCGSKQKAGTKFCDNCGQPMEASQRVFKPSIPKWAKLSKSDRIGIIAAGAAAVVVLLAVLISSLFSSGPEAAAKKYMKAFTSGNAKAVLNMVHRNVLEELADSADMDKDEMIDSLQDNFDDIEDQLEDTSWKVLRVKEYDKDDEEYEKLEEVYEDNFDLKVKGVAKVKVKMELDDDEETEEFWFVKIGSKWYWSDYNLLFYLIQ